MLSTIFYISSLEFSDGSTIEIKQGEIVVFVGPNNSGKSAALKAIQEKTGYTEYVSPVLNKVHHQKPENICALYEWISKACKVTIDPSLPNSKFYWMLDSQCPDYIINDHWSSKKGISTLADFFICLLSTENRLSASKPPKNINFLHENFTHPIHQLYRDDKIEKRISQSFREAFGEDLIVNKGAGNIIPLHCGIKPTTFNNEDRTSTSYIEKLEKLPQLQNQGDGMRAFVGVMLYATTFEQPVVLIDEPEAFLHPPQAKLLAKKLALEVPENRQLFISTHSGDIINGLLESGSQRVRIVRIKREGNINIVHQLSNRDVANLWKDPLLRYSNIFDGLFHDKIIICEGDADCRFYGAVTDYLYSLRPDISRKSIMFSHCGGKDRIPTVINALRSTGVDITTIVDFDILSSENTLQKIWTALGGAWSEIEKDWKLVKNAIEQKKPELSSRDVKKLVSDVLQQVNDSHFPLTAKKEIDSILKQSSPWTLAKQGGKFYIPSGEPTTAFSRLSLKMSSLGLFIVEIGDLEQFYKQEGRHGPRWATAVLSRENIFTDPELDTAKSFMKKVLQMS